MTKLTIQQQKLLKQLKNYGEAWVVPAQMKMVRLLQSYDLLRVADERRFDKSKNIYLRRVVQAEQEDA